MRASDGEGVVVVEGLLHQAVYRVLTAMCFGEGLDGGTIAAVEELHREFLKSVVGFQVFGGTITKLLFWRRYRKMLCIRRGQEELIIPLILRARKRRHDAGVGEDDGSCYVDSILGLRIPEADGGGGGRSLTEPEMVSLCTEFLSGADSMVTALQWTMANLVARPDIQAKLRAEIDDVVTSETIGEEHLQRMPYLRAVVLEVLRRHPPGRFMLPHAATDEAAAAGATISGFVVPKNASVNFTVGGMAMDEEVWREPRRFRPERFLAGGEGEDVDLTGSREIKMMPFGAGRRACPGMDMSMLHLEYFVATMVKEFVWMVVPGETVDFADKLELTMVMRRPLRAKVLPCNKE
ncbi:unnamed protein product [Urochloa humidicola]